MRNSNDWPRSPSVSASRSSIDDIAVAEGLSRIGRRLRQPLDVFVEVDSGQHRCGRAPGTDSADLAERIAASDGLRLAGLMTHAGHSYGAESVDDRRRIALDEARAVVETAWILEQRGVAGLELSIGSTPSVVHLAEVTAAYPAITEARPGNYVFLDANQVSMEVATEAECALTVLSTIVSRPAPDRAVADAGSKTLGGDGPAPRGRGFGRLLGEPRAAVDRVSEEHAWIRLDADVPWRIGDRVRIIPNHACVVPNLAPTLLGVRGNVVERVDRRRRAGHEPLTPTPIAGPSLARERIDVRASARPPWLALDPGTLGGRWSRSMGRRAARADHPRARSGHPVHRAIGRIGRPAHPRGHGVGR